MSDHERGAYAPPIDPPLSFDPRRPVRGPRPLPFTLIVSMLVLVALAIKVNGKGRGPRTGRRGSKLRGGSIGGA